MSKDAIDPMTLVPAMDVPPYIISGYTLGTKISYPVGPVQTFKNRGRNIRCKAVLSGQITVNGVLPGVADTEYKCRPLPYQGRDCVLDDRPFIGRCPEKILYRGLPLLCMAQSRWLPNRLPWRQHVKAVVARH